MPAEGFVRAGKVRDLYAIGEDRLLLVASDRLSAFDVVLPTPIPDKGRVLTGLSRFWFGETERIVANHLLSTDLEDVDPADLPTAVARHSSVAWAEERPGLVTVQRDPVTDELRGRAMLCRRVDVLPVECIVRGYLSGTGWRDYRAQGTVAGIELPAGLRESEGLPEPIFTPSTKAELGAHDETITFDRMTALVGGPVAERVRDAALRLYRFGAELCERAGVILADTKLEFGVWPGPGDVMLVDEVMTPDSSRFWDLAAYAPGGPQPSYDKQYVRDWLEASGWDKTAPGPELPAEVVAGTRARYVEAFEKITGASFARYLEADVIGR